MGQINTNNYPAVDSLADTDLLIVENAANGTGTTTPKQLRENAIGTDPLQTSAQTVTGAINELKTAIDAGAGVVCYDVDSVTQGRLGSYSGDVKYLLIHFDTDAEPYSGAYSLVLSYSSGSVAIMQYGALYDRVMGMEYDREICSGSTLLCEIMDEGTGTEADPVHVDVLGVIDGYVTAGWGRQAALGDRATAEGIGTEASGNYAHAQGSQTTASGNQSTAMGYGTTASADGATAMGNGSRASGVNSIAGGYNTTASGAVSMAIGTNTQATQQAQVATGKYNRVNNDALVMVGNGTGASARSNALEVLLNGDVVAGNEIIDGQGNTLSVLAEALTKTASGNPVVITDCAGGKARSLKTTIEAIQDLHGLPFPYVGGAYKNKYINSPDDFVSAHWTVQSEKYNGHNVYKRTGAWSGMYVLCNLPIGTYTYSTMVKTNDSSNVNVYLSMDNVSTAVLVDITPTTFSTSTTWQRISVTFTVQTAGTVACRVERPTDGDIYVSEYQLERGSAVTSYAPYSNICPISGRTSETVNVCGQNLFSKVYVDNSHYLKSDGTTASDANFHITEFIPVSANTDYILSGISGNNSPSICVYDANYNFLFGTSYSGNPTVTINTGASGRYVKFSVRDDAANSIMFECGTTKSASYIPYTGNANFTIQLGQTVYGADINWDTGVASLLDVKEVLTDISQLYGNAPNVSSSGNWMGMQISSLPLIEAANINLKCSIAKPVPYNNRTAGDVVGTDRAYIDSDPNGVVILRLSNERSDITTKADFFAHFTGAEVCYKLATPQTIQLTPEQLEMLKGYNRVTIEDGSIELGYIAKLT